MCVKGFLLSFLLVFGLNAFEYPNEFQIRQNASRRGFGIFVDDRCIGEAFNSAYGQFDFYDENLVRVCTNLFDDLYDSSGDLLGFIQWKKDAEAEKWFWQRKWMFCSFKTHILLFSNKDIPILSLDEEGEGDSGGGNAFVFRSYEIGKPVAVALWSWEPFGNPWIPCLQHLDHWVQNWNVIIVDHDFLEEQQISPFILTWALLKHSQLHFPASREYPYMGKAEG